MQLTIFGATGRTGQILVQQALEAGHTVVALARTPTRLTLSHPQLQIVVGSIADRERVEQAVQGSDVVLSVLGPSSNKPEFAISLGMDTILSAMKKQDVRRIIMSAGAGVRDPKDRPRLIDRVAGLMLRLFARNVAEDMRQAVQKVRASDRDWTIVRVPMLTDQPSQGRLKVGYVGEISPRISRADLAAFMLLQITDETYVGKAPAISN